MWGHSEKVADLQARKRGVIFCLGRPSRLTQCISGLILSAWHIFSLLKMTSYQSYYYCPHSVDECSNVYRVTQWVTKLGFGSRICPLSQAQGTVFAFLISYSAYLVLNPSGSCQPSITHSSYKLKLEWIPRRRNPSHVATAVLKVERRHQKGERYQQKRNQHRCWWKHCKRAHSAPSFWPSVEILHFCKTQESPIVLVPRTSSGQISLPYSLPPMEVLWIVSFSLLLNV